MRNCQACARPSVHIGTLKAAMCYRNDGVWVAAAAGGCDGVGVGSDRGAGRGDPMPELGVPRPARGGAERAPVHGVGEAAAGRPAAQDAGRQTLQRHSQVHPALPRLSVYTPSLALPASSPLFLLPHSTKPEDLSSYFSCISRPKFV